MTVIVNQSLYPLEVVQRAFWHGRLYHCMSIKACFSFNESGQLGALRKAPEVEHDEVWRGRPMRSSLLHPGDLIPFKPNTDVLVVGAAVAPDEKPVRRWDAALRFPGGEKRLRLCGPRAWRHSLLSGWTLSEPEPVSRVKLIYENAYGGVVDESLEHFEEGTFFPPNPFGCGFVGAKRVDTQREHRAAQVEAWEGSVDRFGAPVAVGGLGPIPGFFPSRARFMGKWEQNGAPTVETGVPADMDMRYWNCAPEDQQSEHVFAGGELIQLQGMTREGQLSLELPSITAVNIAEFSSARRSTESLALDTVIIDLDRKQLQLRYHGIREVSDALKELRVVCALAKPLKEHAAHG